jgi:DNA-binding MarR family transcriptional regulator
MATTVNSRTAAAEELGAAFKSAMAAVRRLRGRDTHHPDQLSYAQYGLLFELARAGELPSGELACAADLAPASVTQMLDHLEASGLVERTRSETDRRVVVCRLTGAGAERVAQRRAEMEPQWQAALAEFDADELRAAAAVLNRLRDFFDARR